jgi:uncharacterized protein YecE (DUF72 family)
MTAIYVGTSGWTYPDWQGVFYPPEVKGSRRLEYYAQRFDTVEVNATFYRLPTPAMIAAWNQRLPQGFHLVLKGSRLVTHRRKLVEVDEPLQNFLERALALQRLEVILWQLPPSLHRDLPRLQDFLARLPQEVRHAVEFRHASWWHPDTAELLARFGAAFVAVSHPRLPPDILPTADFLYLRFHGLGPKLYRYDYSRAELEEWVRRLEPHLAGRELYAFFNNDYQAHAPANAELFRELLQA